ncbi:unnamed protein product [Acanthoscelides obtectus]|uniref:Uncharacterized protein n=1 Tax=Acanthoscelides obtectus TaxID=200917 RepID=A0A9P0LAX5_ACAOB|nr:unnamed protein product [Acanthoscelides obtectus]CAH1990995.1 unnamed protein product [Acanthoscelides obtectus]CAH2009102.1 unnamed protein product [Acanthoscelides obtectus]CAK1635629.1 hypothetical protein AOBTE_LOCUS9401 [Acanthoscelides obtectus]CAK1647587.1 hypothetical protein AOBTE_LOCUS15285 [Acanthoscelides obtectus]
MDWSEVGARQVRIYFKIVHAGRRKKCYYECIIVIRERQYEI